MSVLRLEDLDALADALAARLAPAKPTGLLDTAEVAEYVHVSTDWVRDHAAELGAIRVGDGAHGALRFKLALVDAALDRRRIAADAVPAPRRRPGPAPKPHGNVELIALPAWAAA